MADALSFLDRLGTLPKMISEGRKLLGTVETPGAGNTPAIMGWASELGLNRIYTADAVPWCGLFVAIVAKRAGKVPVNGPLWALNWARFGTPAGQPGLGDVLTFIRPGGGHVALYVGEDNTSYHVLGGNQSDRVCVTRIAKSRLHSARIPPFKVQMPESRRPIILRPNGQLSENEA
jgi:uncharacterized protein (TIGR02594 family)